MTNVFLVPSGKEEGHFRSIKDGVSIAFIKSALKREERERPERIYKDGRVRVWGTEPKRKMRTIWEKMRDGDILLFSPKGTGRYKYYGEVAFTSHNKELAKRLQELVWEKEGQKYEHIFYVKNLREINIPKETVNQLAGYEGSRIPIFLMPVGSPDSAKKIIKLLSTPEVSEVEVETALVPLTPKVSITHSELIDMLVKLGEFYGKHSEREFLSGPYRYDVVWKRTSVGNPNKVFEVHHKGVLDSALAKLKHAFDIWNSDLFLVIINPEDKERARTLLTGSFHEIGEVTTIMQPEEIKELHNYKKRFREIEKKLR